MVTGIEVYRDATFTKTTRDELALLGVFLSTLATITQQGIYGRYALAVQDIVERWDENSATEQTFPVYADAVAS